MIIRHLCFILLAFAAVTRTTFAQTNPFACQPPQLLGMISGLNNPTSMTIDGNDAYIIEQK
ncbi:MAG TPA: hypothetical protein DF699_12420, partial [Phycisphaerales bacterium]|nr:hypothetical protein [Phycisphaerales bacterium]